MILDTNALSAVADDEPAVVRLYRQAASMELPVIVLGEYRFGIGQSRRRGEYEKWLRELIAATRVLVIEEETSRHYAGIRAELKKGQLSLAAPRTDPWEMKGVPDNPNYFISVAVAEKACRFEAIALQESSTKR